MDRGRDVVEAAKDYRLARPDATANMIEDVLRDRFLGDAREQALADRVGRYGGYVGLPLSGVVGFLVGRLREWWSPPDRQATHGRIKAAVQIALAADMAAHAARVARRAVRLGVVFGLINLGVATAFAVAAESPWTAALFAAYGAAGLVRAAWESRRLTVTATAEPDPSPEVTLEDESPGGR